MRAAHTYWVLRHLGFPRVDANKKLPTKVPFHFINADINPGVKLQGGIVSHVMNEVDVKCLPANLPEYIVVDLKDLSAGHSLHISQLALPEGVAVVHAYMGHVQALRCRGTRGVFRFTSAAWAK